MPAARGIGMVTSGHIARDPIVDGDRSSARPSPATSPIAVWHLRPEPPHSLHIAATARASPRAILAAARDAALPLGAAASGHS